MKYIFLSLMLYVLSAQAQSVTDTVFMDDKGRRVSHDHYSFFRVVNKEAGVYMMRDYTNEGRLVRVGPVSSLHPEIKNGFFITYYPSGEKYMESEYYNDKQRGTEKVYYPDGKLLTTGEYKDGLLDGKAIKYEDDGSKVIKIFKAGVLVSTSVEPAPKAAPAQNSGNIFAGERSMAPDEFKERLKQQYELLPDSIRALKQTVSVSYELDSNGLMTNIQPSKHGNKVLSDLILQTAREIPTNNSLARSAGSGMVTGYSIMVTFPDMFVATSMSMSSRSKPVNNSLDMFETKPAGSADLFDFFAAGVDTFGTFLQHRFAKTAFAKDTKTVAEVSLTFELDKDGKAQNIKINKGSDKKRAAFVLNAMKEYPKWHLDTTYGGNNTSHHEITVNFPGCTSTINSSSSSAK